MMPFTDKQNVSYFKRFKMEMSLDLIPSIPALPAEYYWVPWQENLVQTHADVLFECFHSTIDAIVFPSLGDRTGCFRLMREIRRKSGFLPEATWLLACPSGYCGTVQGVRENNGMGAIQNLGIVPTHRGQGLGTTLLLQSLHGFRRARLKQVLLEVTAQNAGAVRLYHHLGFRSRKTVYKAVVNPTPKNLWAGLI